MKEVFEEMIFEAIEKVLKDTLELFRDKIGRLQWASESINDVIICASLDCKNCPYRDDKYERFVCIFTLDTYISFIENRCGMYRCVHFVSKKGGDIDGKK